MKKWRKICLILFAGTVVYAFSGSQAFCGMDYNNLSGNYPGKWYGWHAPKVMDPWTPPKAGIDMDFENRKIIKSWGYKADNPIEEIKDLLPKHCYDIVSNSIYGHVRINQVERKPWKGEQWEKYMEATKKNKGKAYIDKNGNLQNWFGGMPFPDAKTGREHMWNQVKKCTGDDKNMPWVAVLVDSGGHTRYIVGENCYIYFDGRLTLDPKPSITDNPKGLEYIHTFGYLEPYDMRGTVPLFYRYKDARKRDDSWMYLPTLRRVRRMSASQRWDRVPGGMVLQWEIFEGFDGKVSDYEWKLIGMKKQLMPCSANTSLPQIEPGKLLACPDLYWELKDVVWIEGTPKDPDCIVSKVLYGLDPETYEGGYVEVYDNKGKLWVWHNQNYSVTADGVPQPQNMTYMNPTRRTCSNFFVSRSQYNIGYTPEWFDMEKLKKHFGAVR